jgi:hypothetical protein
VAAWRGVGVGVGWAAREAARGEGERARDQVTALRRDRGGGGGGGGGGGDRWCKPKRRQLRLDSEGHGVGEPRCAGTQQCERRGRRVARGGGVRVDGVHARAQLRRRVGQAARDEAVHECVGEQAQRRLGPLPGQCGAREHAAPQPSGRHGRLGRLGAGVAGVAGVAAATEAGADKPLQLACARELTPAAGRRAGSGGGGGGGGVSGDGGGGGGGDEGSAGAGVAPSERGCCARGAEVASEELNEQWLEVVRGAEQDERGQQLRTTAPGSRRLAHMHMHMHMPCTCDMRICMNAWMCVMNACV